MRRPVPEGLRWVLWDLDADALDVDEHADAILARVLENGRLDARGDGRRAAPLV